MTIRTVCSSCEAVLNVKDEYAGKRGKCPKCGEAVHVPEAAEEESAKSPTPRVPPATERQKVYATQLGIEFDENINCREISELIDAAVERRDEERYQRLEQLQQGESEARAKMREEVLRELDDEDPRLNNASPQDMVQEISNRGDAAIMITFDPGAVDENFGAGTVINHWFSDDLTHEDMRKVVMAIAGQFFLDAQRNGTEDSAS